MRKGLIFFLIAFAYINEAQVFFKFTNDTLKPYSYSGGDEFNLSEVNQNDWSLTPWPRTNMGQFFTYESGNTTIENGVAVFSLKQKDSLYTINPIEMDSSFIRKRKIKLDEHKYQMKYSAGIIISKQKYHYGLYELRFKVEKGQGVWPAFWFFGGNKNEEIDIFELKGEKNNRIHVDTHCPYGCDRGYKNKLGFNSNWGDWMPVSNYLHEGFNIMLLDWKPGEITWFINGYPLAYFKGDFPNPMNIYINTQVASEFSAFQPPPNQSTTYPNNFYVDYIRIWKNTEANNQIVLEARGDLSISERFISDYKNKALRHRGLMYKRKKFKAEEGMIALSLLPANKINVTVLGELNNESYSLALNGQYGTYNVKDFSGENKFEIDPRESEFTLIVKKGEKQYSQKIVLSR